MHPAFDPNDDPLDPKYNVEPASWADVGYSVAKDSMDMSQASLEPAPQAIENFSLSHLSYIQNSLTQIKALTTIGDRLREGLSLHEVMCRISELVDEVSAVLAGELPLPSDDIPCTLDAPPAVTHEGKTFTFNAATTEQVKKILAELSSGSKLVVPNTHVNTTLEVMGVQPRRLPSFPIPASVPRGEG